MGPATAERGKFSACEIHPVSPASSLAIRTDGVECEAMNPSMLLWRIVESPSNMKDEAKFAS
jgi:hypothetical protein